MALDYSKLSDEDLQALADNDYSKLSDETLKMLAEEGEGPKTPEEGTQGTSPVGAAVAGYKIAQPIIHGAKQIATNPVVDVIGAGAVAPWLLKRAGGYLAEGAGLKGGPSVGGAASASNVAEDKLYQQAMDLARAAEAQKFPPNTGPEIPRTLRPSVGQGLINQGALPGALSLPYLMSAYEQAKIRANPTAPQYATNPYAMSYRSQGTATPITQGPKPLCAYFVKEISRQSEIIYLDRLF